MLLRGYLRDYWLSIKDKPILSSTSLFALLGQQITLVCSPLSIDLVKLTRSNYSKSDSRRIDLIESFYELPSVYDSFADDEEEHWSEILIQPGKLVECIKRYHCAGNGFFVAVTVHFGAICYLASKAWFHSNVTGTDQVMAEYYADRYFPRLFHTYTTPFLDSQLFDLTLFILAFRLSRLFNIVKNSIINRNGYKFIAAQQSSFTAITAFRLPLSEWKQFWHLINNHHKDCIEDAEIRRTHRRFEEDVEKVLRDENMFEFSYFRNLFSFEQCYSVLKTHRGADGRASWAKDWFVPEPIMRLDPMEFCWLIWVSIVGYILLVGIVTSLIFMALAQELCALALENDEDSCLLQLPSFVSSLSRLIRFIDIIVLVLVQIPPQIEGANFYWDCCVMISRANKIRGALEEDMEQILRLEQSDDDDRSRKFRNLVGLNRTIWLHIRLMRCVYQEFRDLKKCHTVFLNILLIGGGLFLSIGVRNALKSDSLFKVFVASSLNVATCAIMTWSIMFCIMTESAVSSSKYRK